jgi:hypothetical protein
MSANQPLNANPEQTNPFPRPLQNVPNTWHRPDYHLQTSSTSATSTPITNIVSRGSFSPNTSTKPSISPNKDLRSTPLADVVESPLFSRIQTPLPMAHAMVASPASLTLSDLDLLLTEEEHEIRDLLNSGQGMKRKCDGLDEGSGLQ